MTCRSRDLLLDPRTESRDLLLAHAAGCEECSALLALQAKTNTTLAVPALELDAISRARVWQRVEAGRVGARWDLRWVLPTVAVAVIAGMLLLWPKGQEPLPEGWVDYAAAQTIELEGATIAVRERAKIALLEPRSLRIFRGSIAVEVSTPPALQLETPRVKISALAAKFVVDVQKDSTSVHVIRGSVTANERELDEGVIMVFEDEKVLKSQTHLFADEPLLTKKPEPKPRPKRSIGEQITEARAMVGRDDRRAVQLAEEVLERRPKPAVQIEALMIAGDAHRRRNELSDAQRRYASVVEHSAAGDYREEATLRLASVLADQDQNSRAIELLSQAPRGGNLLPERVALEARLRLERGDLEGARRVLDAVRENRDRVLAPVRARLRELEEKK
jgi:hypothetical protein